MPRCSEDAKFVLSFELIRINQTNITSDRDLLIKARNTTHCSHNYERHMEGTNFQLQEVRERGGNRNNKSEQNKLFPNQAEHNPVPM